MFELRGKHTTAKVYADEVEPEVIAQVTRVLNHLAFTQPIAIMPDVHAGKGSVVGFTMPLKDKVVPNVVGVDIGCGMLAGELSPELLSRLNLAAVDEKIREWIPMGFETQDSPVLRMENFPFQEAARDVFSVASSFNLVNGSSFSAPAINYKWFQGLCERIEIDPVYVERSLGTLGGGNHFIEIGRDQADGQGMATVHSGSRKFGLHVATYHQRKAGPGDLDYLEGQGMFDYLVDMAFAQAYASINRRLMMGAVLDACGFAKRDPRLFVESVHNYIDPRDFTLRKGAIRSYVGEPMIIPFNMRDGLLLCEGESNPAWNHSAPHGAGRVLSRSRAKKILDVRDFEDQMQGIFSTSVGASTLDEAPDAYKDAGVIEALIQPTAKILRKIKPVINLKARGKEKEGPAVEAVELTAGLSR